MLSAIGLEVRARGRTILNPTSLSWPDPQRCILLGPNGAGKSTLLRALSGDRRGTAGQVLISGIPWERLTSVQRMRAVAYVPQATALAFGYTVDELLRLASDEPEVRERAITAMELEALRHHPLTHLSGGEKQRALLARALSQNAPILLLDEPFAALDLRHSQRLEAALHTEASRGVLVIIALHDLAQARRLGSRLILLDKGRVVADGAEDSVLTGEMLKSVYGIDTGSLTSA